MRIITIARPEDLDLAVPPLVDGKSSATLCEISEGYSRFQPSWVRAVNVEYRVGASGPAMGVLSEGGTVWHKSYLNWPAFYIDSDDSAHIAPNAHQVDFRHVRMAFSAAPILLRFGQVTDITGEILRTNGLDDSLRPEQLLPRAAIGIRPADGAVVHIADMAATLPGIAADLRLQGCTEAVTLDGGGSVGVVDRQGKMLLGESIRRVCSALMFKAVMETQGKEKPEKEPPSMPGEISFYYHAQYPAGYVRANFEWREFACKGTGGLLIARYLVDMCQHIRTKLGGPLVINSAYRAPSHNARVGGEPDSLHTAGLAVDLSTATWGEARIVSLARDFGWRGGLGHYAGFVHLDIGPVREWRG